VATKSNREFEMKTILKALIVVLLTLLIVSALFSVDFSVVSAYCKCDGKVHTPPLTDAQCAALCGGNGSGNGAAEINYQAIYAQQTAQAIVAQATAQAIKTQQTQIEQNNSERKEQFEQGKQSALKELKDISNGLSDNNESSGMDLSNNSGFKDIDAGAGDPSVVDLRHLDPNKPVTVDGSAIKGTTKLNMADKAFKNPNYLKGFDILINGDSDAAIACFEKVIKDMPDNILVRDSLELAREAKNEKDSKDKDSAALEVAIKGAKTAVFDKDYEKGLAILKKANAINPANEGIRDAMKYIEGVVSGMKRAKKEDGRVNEIKAVKIAAECLPSIEVRDYKGALKILQEAHFVKPDDAQINDLIETVKKWDKGNK
jgi:tetratricopeptide (TPR) repeat protein